MGHKLFDSARLPAEAAGAGGAGAGPSSEAGAAAAAAGLDAAAIENTAAGRVLSALGNALFFGGVAAASFFGYYTYRYDAEQMERMVEATASQQENAFVGSSLWVPVMTWYVSQRRRAEGELSKYAAPPSDQLLPDLPPHARHIKTLVLDLDDVLVHSDWTRGRWGGGWGRGGVYGCMEQGMEGQVVGVEYVQKAAGGGRHARGGPCLPAC